MGTTICPECQAELDSDLIQSRGVADCPYCGTHLDGFDFHPAELSPLLSAESAPERERDTFSASASLPAAQHSSAGPVPAGSRIQILNPGPDRLMLYIPGGGKLAGGLGILSLFWNGFVAVFSVPIVLALFGQGQRDDALMGLAFLGGFWFIGAVILFFWLKMKYERTYVAIDSDRVVLQRILFKRKRVETVLLEPGSHADLVESYRENERPVYRVDIRGAERNAKFGTALTQEEKEWLVATINRFLGASPPPVPASDGAQVLADLTASLGPVSNLLSSRTLPSVANPDATQAIPDDLDPADLPAGSSLRIDADHARELQFSYPFLGHSAMRMGVPIALCAFGGIWCGIVGVVFGVTVFAGTQDDWLGLLCIAPMLLPGLAILLVGLSLAMGRVTVTLTDDRLAARWHVLFAGRTWRMNISDIQTVAVQQHQAHLRVNRRPVTMSTTVCRVESPDQAWSLGSGHRAETVNQIAGLLRSRLRQQGIRLQDV